MEQVLCYQDAKDDPGFLSLDVGTAFYDWFMQDSPGESWSNTAHRMTNEGIPCKDIWDIDGMRGFLFENPKQKFEFILRCT